MEKIPNQIVDGHQQDGQARPSPAGGEEGLAPTCSCSSASDGLERTSKGESEMPKARPSPKRNVFHKSFRRCCMLTTDPQMFQLPLALCPKTNLGLTKLYQLCVLMSAGGCWVADLLGAILVLSWGQPPPRWNQSAAKEVYSPTLTSLLPNPGRQATP